MIRRNLSALQRGDFSSTDVAPQVLVKLRDELCAEESAMLRPPSTATVPVEQSDICDPKRYLRSVPILDQNPGRPSLWPTIARMLNTNGV